MADSAFAGSPKIEIKEYKIDLQQLKSGVIITREVEITNSGSEDLIIKKIRCTCDCLTASISNEEIDPGKIAIITFKLDTDDVERKFTKYIYIQSNDPSKPVSRIIISGTVIGNAGPDQKGSNNVK